MINEFKTWKDITSSENKCMITFLRHKNLALTEYLCDFHMFCEEYADKTM